MVKKAKASLIHLLLSATIVSAFIVFALIIWYPQPFFEISGLKQIILILLSVDLILGPLLTFIVFKPNKPSLKFDLAFIGAVQIAALAYGIYTVYQGHPAYVAYAVDRFTLTNINDVDPADAKYPELQASGWWKPALVYAKLPSDPKEQEKLVLEVLAGKQDIDARPEYYEPFQEYRDKVLAGGIALDKINSTAGSKAKLDEFLNEHGNPVHQYAFFPLTGKEKDIIWVWDRKTGEPVGTLDINPWSLGKVNTAYKE